MEDLGFINDLFIAFENFLSSLTTGFNAACSFIFRNGNIVLFVIFLIMGVNLLFNAKNKEYHEKLYAKNLEYAKKRGRIGTAVCILLAIASLSKGFLVFLDWCFGSFPTPLFFSLEPFKKFYITGTSVEAVATFDLYDSFLYYLFSLLSLLSIVIIVLSFYLIVFNKRILRTKFKSYKLLGSGILLAIIYGIPTSVRLMI